MPPAIPVQKDVESVNGEDVKHTKPDPSDTSMAEGDDEEEDEEDEDEETFIVEAIHDHRSDFEDGQLRYQVKWKGYEKKADRTWETEENLEGAKEALEEYWEKAGGRTDPDQPKPTKKRGRQSNASAKATGNSAKKPRTSKAGQVGEDDWKPPTVKDGSWDPLIQSVDTVIREASDGELWGYLIWNEKNDDGRFYRSKAKLPVIYRACPQRMLQFYEKHLVFSTDTNEATAEGQEVS